MVESTRCGEVGTTGCGVVVSTGCGWWEHRHRMLHLPGTAMCGNYNWLRARFSTNENCLFQSLEIYMYMHLNILWEIKSSNIVVIAQSLNHVWLFAAPWTVAHQAPLSMELSRQEYLNGLPFPSPRDLPNPGIEPVSLASDALAGGFFTTSATWEASYIVVIQEFFSKRASPSFLLLLCLWGKLFYWSVILKFSLHNI